MKPKVSTALQVLFVAALVAILAAMALTARDNLVRQNIATGFGFLFDRTGWDVAASFLPHTANDPYWYTFLIGLINTILLSIVCIVLATVSGLLLALAGSGRSRILFGLARGYVYLFRNTPIIVQLFFWYHVTRQLPPVREAKQWLGCCYASNRGIYIPHVGVDAPPWAIAVIAIAALVAAASFHLWNRRRSEPWPHAATVVAAALGAFVAVLATANVDVTLPK